jgi:hypothetical protein
MRAFNRLLCLLLALVIAAAGVLAVLEIIAATTDHDPVVVKWHGFVNDLATNEWKTAGPRVAGIVLILVGLLLLFFALRRGKPANIALTTAAPETDLTTTRRSLQRSLSNAAASVDGVAEAKAKVKRRKVVVKGRAGTSDRTDAQSRLTNELQERLDGLSLAEPLRLKVKLAAALDKKTPEVASGVSSTPPDTTSSSSGDRTPAGVGSGSSSGPTAGGSA